MHHPTNQEPLSESKRVVQILLKTMKILHIFSSKVFAGLERHVEELAFEQSKENSVLVIGPVKFEGQFRVNYKSHQSESVAMVAF